MIHNVVRNFIFKPHYLINTNIRLSSCTSKFHKSSSVTSVLDTKQEWTPIYRLPLIRIIAAFNKIKIYQSVITLFGTPILYYAELMNQLPESSTAIFASLGVTGSLTLTLTSLFTTNLIGIIYIKKDTNEVKFAYVDFWGNRKHIELHIDDIIPPDNTVKTSWDFYQLVKTNEKSVQNFKLLQRFGVVLDREKFSYIFGE